MLPIEEYVEELKKHKKLGVFFGASLVMSVVLLCTAGSFKLAADLLSCSCLFFIVLFHLFFAAPAQKRIGVKRMAFFFLCIFAISSFIWFFQNYNVYYSARESMFRTESKIIYRSIANILWRNMKPETKRDRLDKLLESNAAEITVTEEGKDEPLYFRKSRRSDKYYIIESFETEETQTVTIRNRDTMTQDRVALSDVRKYIEDRMRF